MLLPQDNYIQVGGIKTRYWQLGTGTPLVLLHGIGHAVRAFDRNIHALATRHTVYAFDMKGHGLTDKPNTSYHIDDLAKFVRDWMAEMYIPRAHVLAHSMGGGIAIRFAAKFPDRVNKLVLAAPAGFCKEIYLGFRLGTVPVLGEFLTRPSRRTVKQLTEATVYDNKLVTDELIDWQYEYAQLPGAQNAILSVLREHANFSGLKPWVRDLFNSEAHKITAPTLVVWGEKDEILPYEQSKLSVEKIKGAKLHTFRYCGHQPHYEYADDFNRLVLDFLGS